MPSDKLLKLKSRLSLYILFFAFLIYGNKVLAVDIGSEHCGIAINEISLGYDRVAVTESKYLRLAYDISTSPDPFMYVMSRKPPHHGKAYYVEFMSSACMTASLHLRADDGTTAFITFWMQGPHCEPCLNGDEAQIIWGGPKTSDELEEKVFFLYAGSAKNYYASPKEFDVNNPNTQTLERETLDLYASKSICKIEYDTNKGDEFNSCVAHRSGLIVPKVKHKKQRERP